MSEVTAFPPLASQKVKTIGHEVSFLVPSTVEHYDFLAKSTGAALTSAIMNVIYRSNLNEFRASFTERIQEVTKIERKTVDTGKKRKVKHEDGTETEEPVIIWDKDDTESVYYDRVLATLATERGVSIDEVRLSFQPLADEIAASIVFDPSERAPATAGPKKIAKQYTDAAKTIIAAGKAETVAAKLSVLLNRPVGTDEASLAAAISEDQRRKAKELAATYGAD